MNNIKATISPYSFMTNDIEGVKIKPEKIEVDGLFWIRETVCGYRREKDDFFWPHDPRNNNNCLKRYPPSIEKIEKMRNKYLK